MKKEAGRRKEEEETQAGKETIPKRIVLAK